MLTHFIRYVSKYGLVSCEGGTLVAVSGGVDSVVLADLFKEAGFSFAIAHCHFGLREGSADEDQRFVRELARCYGVPFYTRRFATSAYAREQGVSVQVAARRLRYGWFEALVEEYGFGQVATGHHVDDGLESFLYHVAKGTGIAGLHGILPRRGGVVRPLGFASRREIMTYARERGLEWREDESNGLLRYRRNWIRHRVVPALRKVNPSLERTFASTLCRLRQVEDVFKMYVEEVRGEAFCYRAPYYYMDLAKADARGCPPVVVFEWLREFGFRFPDVQRWWEDRPGSGRRLYSRTHWLVADRGCWVLGRRGEGVDDGVFMVSAEARRFSVGGSVFEVKKVARDAGYRWPRSCDVAALDAGRLCFPMRLRVWRQGDVFYPLGMGHRKRVSDFLIDLKVPVYVKEGVRVLVSGEDIVWVVGYRIDDRFKVAKLCKQVYEIGVRRDALVD